MCEFLFQVEVLYFYIFYGTEVEVTECDVDVHSPAIALCNVICHLLF